LFGIEIGRGKLVEMLDFAYDYAIGNRTKSRRPIPRGPARLNPFRKEPLHGQG
jgi:hypothetical protein